MNGFALIACALVALLGGWFLGLKQAEKSHAEKLRLAEAERDLLRLEKVRLETELKASREAGSDLDVKFEAMAARILAENSESLRRESERELNLLLNPLKDVMASFRVRVDSLHSSETEQRARLEQRLLDLAQSSGRLSERAENLGKAISGGVKAQGTWGEVKLEDLLEQAGLSSGSEYFAQGEGLGLKFDDGRHARPDFVVLLPGKRHLIIDSKVSMESYLRACAATDDAPRREAARELALSMRKHVKDLADKSYHKLEGLNPPGFVMMFVPFEGALSLAAEEDKMLVRDAVDREIVIATPTTLFSMMRAVNLIWTQERQNKNVQDIAERAGLLYDKFADFYEELLVVGKNIQTAHEAFDRAVGRLGSGRGNLIRQTEELKSLGAKAKKALPPRHVEQAFLNHEKEQGI